MAEKPKPASESELLPSIAASPLREVNERAGSSNARASPYLVGGKDGSMSQKLNASLSG